MSDRTDRRALPPAPAAGDLEAWVRLARSDADALAERLRGLGDGERLRLALRLPPEVRLEVLLHDPQPMRSVRRLPAAELYLTVRAVGPIDALPVLALASATQVAHVLDLESWRRDRYDVERAGAWVAVLIESGESTLRRWVRHVDDDTLVLLFRRWARVTAIETDDQVPIHGPGESEAGTERGFVSPDGWHRFAPERSEHAPAVRRLAEMLFTEEPGRYQRLIWEAISGLDSEIEEQALHWRGSRLEEHGYPPWDEAVAIYAPPGRTPDAPAAALDDETATPLAPFAVREDRALAEAVGRLAATEADGVLRQLVAVANRVLVADALDTGDPASHRSAMRKAAGLVNLAVEARVREGGERPEDTLRTVAAIDLFREGHDRVAGMKAAAERLAREGWAAGARRALELLDAPLRARLEGLRAERPAYFDLAAEGGAAFREFRTLSEIDETRGALELAEALGTVLVDALAVDVGRLVLDAELVGEDPPRFSALLLTLLAWHATRREIRLEPLPTDLFADFLRTVASRRTAAPDAPARALTELVRALEARRLPARELGLLEGFGRACLERLAAECGTLDPGAPPDARGVACLIVEPRAGGTA